MPHWSSQIFLRKLDKKKGAQAFRRFSQNKKATGKMPMLLSSTFTVFFLDEDQRIHWKDSGEKSQIRGWAESPGATFTEMDLVSQLR